MSIKGWLRRRFKEAKEQEFIFNEEVSKFRVKGAKSVVVLPKIDDTTKLDIKYPLIYPFAFARIFWDNKSKSLLYKVIEPQLDEEEEMIYKRISDGMIKILELELEKIKSPEKLLKYLQKKVSIVLNEYGLELKPGQYTRIMYYIYRNFIGLNEIEPLMNDPYIEDISCDGVEVPLYLIHKKYGSIKTNIQFNEFKGLQEFVIKLAERSGRYVSYAEPLLDGTLADGSRVQATLSKDITTKGPTFSIRKFRKLPYSAVEMIRLKTASPELLAFIWYALEHKTNILVVGGTASGKTTFLNSIVAFIPPEDKIISIEDSVTGDSKIIIRENEKIRNITIKEFVDKKIDAEVITLDEKGKIIFVKPSSYIKHIVKKDIYEVLTATGRKIKVTQDHSLFSLGDDGLVEMKPTELKDGKSFIAVPRILPIKGEGINEINLMNHLENFKEDFLQGSPINKIFEKYSYSQLKVTKEKCKWWKNHNIIKIKEFLKLDINFSYEELKTLRIKSKSTSYIPVIFDISKEFLEFCGLWIGDGCYDNYNKNSVILSNSDEECRRIFKKILDYTQSNYSIMNDGGVSLRLHSTVFYKFMKRVLKLDGYSSTKKVPKFIFNLSNEQIKHFLRGYFSADGCVKKYEISCASQSYALLQDLQTMFLRFGIIARINDFGRKDKCINMSISASENIDKFKEIGFLQERKNSKLNLLNKKAHHTCSDVIPLSTTKLYELDRMASVKLQYPYLKRWQNIGRDYLQKIAPDGSEFNDLSHTDILWDKVKKVRKINSEEIEVFDLSIPKHEKFLCNNIFVHNTRELNLPHQNWIPSVSRIGFGTVTKEGTRYGEVTMFDLLKESFRQNPDYVIVGEVRGKEAYVLFQGMASGHSSLGTVHGGSVDDIIKRMETPPISLPPSLLESLDMVIVITHATQFGKSARRIKQISEIGEINPVTGKVKIVKSFEWSPLTDKHTKGDGIILKKLSAEYGKSVKEIENEIKDRGKVLKWLYKNKINRFDEVAKYISMYYKNKNEVLDLLKKGKIKEKQGEA